MTPQQFQKKWSKAELKESSAAQSHFNDLCAVLGEPTPTEADAKGEWYCFERGASKVGGGDGWADVWKRGCFGWEYKGIGKNLDAAYAQLQHYAPALENPPLLVVCDLRHIRIHTNWTNTVPKVYDIPLERLAETENLQLLKWLFNDPERLKPGVTREQVTQDAAGRFAQLAERLRERGHEPQRVAHFLNRLVFCLFAEDSGLLPGMLFTRALNASKSYPAQSTAILRQLFAAMRQGGLFGAEVIEWFNGGLFDNDDTIELSESDIEEILTVAKLDWTAMEPSIFGTLFERGLDPSKRSQLGAHYTDAQSIMRIVDPVVVEPLLADWAKCRAAIEGLLTKDKGARPLSSKRKETSKPRQQAEDLYKSFLDRLGKFRVLDPACGSGNFLYLTLQALKGLELRVTLEAEQLGLPRGFVGMNTGVQNVFGIELNSYAAELARVVIWIGEIQWMLRHGVAPSKDPILKPLETIECRDAILNDDGTEAAWPKVDAIIGNPPFLGNKKMRDGLGADYTERLRRCYGATVPGGADLVTYWFDKARAAIVLGDAARAGLVGTNSIRGGPSRVILENIIRDVGIFDAWSDEPWINEGAAVRVSLVCFGKSDDHRLDGASVPSIFADLTPGSADAMNANLTQARRLRENLRKSFMGVTKSGPFDVKGAIAREMVVAPNPGGRPNADVLSPSINGADLTGRPSGEWIINFGTMSEVEAAHYEAPWEYALTHIKAARQSSRTAQNRVSWWRFERPRPELYGALAPLTRYLATPLVSKHRFFVWFNSKVLPENVVIVIARDDDATFGILNSRFHRIWSLRLCTWLGVGNDPRYTPTTTFETFPFPAGLTPNLRSEMCANPHAGAIAAAAIELNELRERWLNPPEWVDRAPEVVPGYPDRIIARAGHEADLKKRTMTNLYNAMPTWLLNAHRDLDRAVANAYGWADYILEMPDEEILRRLLALNLERSE